MLRMAGSWDFKRKLRTGVSIEGKALLWSKELQKLVLCLRAVQPATGNATAPKENPSFPSRIQGMEHTWVLRAGS